MDIDAATSGHIHTAFVAYASEPRTVQEALQSSSFKQWEKAIQAK